MGEEHRVSVLVPFRGGCDWRERAWDYVRARYERHHADWQLLVGNGDDGKWSKGAALDDAASRAFADADVFVLADADVFCDAATLRLAVEIARLSPTPWVVPHRTVRRLGRRATEEVLAGGDVHRGLALRRKHTGAIGGGLVVLSRDAWEAVGGVDPRYQGWGGEDISFGWALETFFGSCRRLDADLWHLWHPPQPSRSPNGRASRNPASNALAGRYREAMGDRARMAALIAERQGRAR